MSNLRTSLTMDLIDFRVNSPWSILSTFLDTSSQMLEITVEDKLTMKVNNIRPSYIHNLPPEQFFCSK